MSHPALSNNGDCKIILILPAKAQGSGKLTPMVLNGQIVAKMKTGTYCIIDLGKGAYNFEFGEGGPIELFTPTTLKVNLNEGETKYIILLSDKLENEYGPHITLSPLEIEEERAWKEIEKCRNITP
jgi:hypothetical protein